MSHLDSAHLPAPATGPDDPAAPTAGAPKLRLTIVGALVGTVVEYYDFAMYGYMATFLAAAFFSAGDPTSALLQTFAVFAVAFFVRIPGGIFFGHIGDKHGRKRALSWTILLMSGATFLIGVLPSYVTLGIWAAIVLILLRILQGFAAGGEVSGANTMAAEAATPQRRATVTALVGTGTLIGALLASSVALLLTSVVPPEAMSEWVWRIPFLISLPIGLIGLFIRSRLDDSAVYKAIEKTDKKAKLPIARMFRVARREVLVMILLGGLITGGYYTATVFVASYLQTTVGLTAQQSFLSSTISLVIGILLMPVGGILSDRIGRRAMLFIGAGSAFALAIPMFMLMGTGVLWHAIVGQTVLFACYIVVNSMIWCAYAESVPTEVRYTAMAFANNTTNTLLGGTAPFIASMLISVTGNPLAPAGYFMFCALLTFVGALFYRDRRGVDLNAIEYVGSAKAR